MAEPNVEPSSGSVEHIENTSEWLDKKLNERDATAVAEPAEPATAQPSSWRDVEIGEDVGNKFFVKRKVGDLEKSYEHAVKSKQDAETRANEYKRQLEQLTLERQAENAARKVLNERDAPAPQTPEAELESLFWTDQAAYTRRVREMARKDAIEEWNTAASVKESEDRQRFSVDAGRQAVDVVAETYGVDKETAQHMVMFTIPHIADEYDDVNVWTNKDVYIGWVRSLYGDPTPAAPAAHVVAPVVPDKPNPPGSKKPAPAATRKPELSTAMNAETEERVRSLAKAMDLDPDFALERARQRAAGRRNA